MSEENSGGKKQVSLKKNVAYSVIKIVLSLIFPMISFPYASRILLPSGIGNVNYAGSIISYFSMLSMLGIQAYGIREAARIRDDRAKLSKFVSEIMTINFIAMIASYIILYFLIFFVPVFKPYRVLLIILSSNVLFTVIGIDWLYSAMENYRYITIRSFIFQLLSILALYILIKKPEDYIKYAVISVCSSGGSNVFNFIHSRKYVDLHFAPLKDCVKHLKYVIVMFGMAIAASVFTMMDTTMIGLMSTAFEVGIYVAAEKGIKLVRSFISTIASTISPRVSYYIGNNDYEKTRNLFNKSLSITLFLSIPATLLIFINSSLIVRILAGKSFINSVSCAQLLSPIILFSSCSLLIDNLILLPMKKEKWNLYSLVSGAVIDFICNLLLIGKYGAFGACIGTLIAEFLMFIIHIFYLNRFYKIGYIINISKHYIFSGLLMILTCIPIYLFVHSYLWIFVFSLIASCIYILYLFFSRDFIVLSTLKRFHK